MELNRVYNADSDIMLSELLAEGIKFGLAIKRGRDAILIEAKTINSNKADEGKQVRLALGQLTYYEGFYVNTQHNPVRKIALFDIEISSAHIDYLEKYNCLTLWITDGFLAGSQNACNFLAKNDILRDNL